MVCQRKEFPRITVCVGDLKNRIELQTRSLVSDLDDPEPVEAFQTIAVLFAAIETSNLQSQGVARFSEVSTDSLFTHAFWVRYRSLPEIPEINNHFVLFNSKRLRLLRLYIPEEDNRYGVLRCTDRGDDDKLAASA